VRGRIIHDLAALHQRYGEVVRVGPTGLSFINPEAWLDIYARKPGQGVFRKDELRYTKDLCINGAQEILTANEADHSRLRRVLAHAFSDKAIREQEPLVRKHVDVLMQQLAKNSTKGDVDMSKWLNWTTFDIIGDLAFGEPFGCLEDGDYHPWVSLIFDTVQAVSVMGAIKQFPLIDAVFQRLIPDALYEKLRDHHQLSIAKVNKRLETTTDRGDFLQQILAHAGSEKEMTKGEIYSNAALLIMAGSETSGTAMAGCTYFLAKHQDVLRKVRTELHSQCSRKEDITFDKVLDSMPYLAATLEEAMRLYPAQPIFTPRRAPAEGAVVAGHFVPPNVSMLPVFSSPLENNTSMTLIG
jgi:cytochrome P450